MMTQNDISSALQVRVNRLQKDANRLFALGNIREHCQTAIKMFHEDMQPSPFTPWGAMLRDNREYRFALSLTLTYTSTKDEIVQLVRGCQEEYLLQEVEEERERQIEDFARMKIASRWYQMKDDDLAWRVFAQNIPYGEKDREEEIHQFFETLDRICILTDILMGHAEEYGIDVDYSKYVTPQEDEIVVKYTPTSNRQAILDQLLALVDKGDWKHNEIADRVKQMLRMVLGLGEIPLAGKEVELSEKLWNLLESGRGERLRVTWQNMIGYYDDRHLLKQKSAPTLNTDFFGDKDGSDNINKGRPSRDNMSSGFREVLPLLDAYVPKLDKKA